jgi:hypothetical protein
MKKKILIIISGLAISTIMIVNICIASIKEIPGISLFSFPSALADSESSDCNLCKVTKTVLGVELTLYSCKPMPNESCSTTYEGVTLSCDNAREC